MKRNYSYFIIKPDGIRFLDNICGIIENNYEGVRYYAIDDFSGVIKSLYYKHFEKKGEKFAKSFEAYLYGLREFFGNYGILVLVADSGREYDDLMQRVYSTKLRIRSEYAKNNIGIVTNYGDERKNKIRIVSVDGKENTPRIMKELGDHRISDVNVIHCPDPNINDTIKELHILFQQGIIKDENMITEQMMIQMRRYRTANLQEDMKEEGYEGGIQPDISGFIKSELFPEDLGEEVR